MKTIMRLLTNILILILFLIGCTPSSIKQDLKKDVATQLNNGIMINEYNFESDGNQIFARLIMPDTKEKVPLVIFSHGFGGNHEQEDLLQREIAKSGIGVFSFDFAGGSGFSIGKSEGNILDMSVFTEANNLIDAFGFASNLDLVDKERIYLIGASQGGVVTTMVANELKGKIKDIFLLYPAFSMFNDAKMRFKNKEAISETTNLMGLTVGEKYFTDIYDVNIIEIMQNVNEKVHIFHGTSAQIVPISYSENAVLHFPNSNLTKIDGMGHSFDPNTQLNVAKQISNVIVNNNQVKLVLTLDNVLIDVEWENNDAINELAQSLQNNALIINLSKYGNFEQVGEIGKNLSQTDKTIKATTGDIMLYSGDKIVMFYGENTWNYTRLGKIRGMNNSNIIKILDKPNVQLKLELLNAK